MKFYYTAFDGSNKTKKGVIDATSLRDATKLLLENGWYIKSLRPRGALHVRMSEVSFGVTLMERSLMVKHLLTMLKAGISISEALDVIAEQSSSAAFKRIMRDVSSKVRAGQRLGDALAKFPKVFDPLFINIIRVGEESGTLEENLQYLANELEDRIELRRNVLAASFYPAIIFSATIGLGLILAYFVLPKIKKLFTSLHFALPLSTKILLWVADIFDRFGLQIIVGVVVALILFRILIAQKFAKPAWHWFVIHVPIVGTIVIDYNLILFNRTLAILLKSGVPIDNAFQVLVKTTSNAVYQRQLIKILPQIQRGKRLSDILGSAERLWGLLFPILTVRMIGVGERSGKLDESLSYLAEYYQREVDAATKNLTTILEPLLLIIVGSIVGFVAVSIITPIYQVTGQFSSRQ